MIYQRISLTTSEPVGEPGPLPDVIAGWASDRELLADFSALDLDPSLGLDDAAFWPVVLADQPTYDPSMELIAPGSLVADQVNKQFVRGWDVTLRPIAERKAAKKAAVAALIETKLAAGYPHDFGGAIGVKVLQTRDLRDQTNWLVSQASYSAAVAGGAGAVMGANFRTEDNININMSYADGLNVLLAMAAWGAAHYARSWALKDAIAAAVDDAALDAIDIDSGWPG